MMDSENMTVKQDAIESVLIRNAFYRKKFHFMLGIYALSWVVIVILACMITYLVSNPPHPLYFLADKAGRLIQEVPIQVPNMATPEVAAWAEEAVQAAYSYDYMNYRRQLQNAQKYFTQYGWQNYMRGLKASNNLVALTERKLVIIAKVAGAPKLLVEGILGGAYAWKFEIPVLTTNLSEPYDDKSKFENTLLVTIIVQRQKSLESYHGLGVVQMIGNLLSSNTSQSLTEPFQ